MSAALPARPASVFKSLRQFARKPAPLERCEMCSLELPPAHDHLVEPAQRKLICACPACAILFEGQSGARYKRVPRRVRYLRDFRLTDGQWESLMVPIEMAFFFRSTPQGKVMAFYPSPAGATESLLSLETWADIVSMNPALSEMESDVTALLVNRMGYVRGAAPAEYYLVPIDECYRLVGLIRTHWRGLSGGAAVWREIGAFFAALRQRDSGVRVEVAGGVGEEAHA